MYYLEKKETEIYNEMMNKMKIINKQWIELRNSKQYKIGLFMLEVKFRIKHFDFKNLLKSFKRWINGKKSAMIINNKINTDVINFEESNYFLNDRIAIYTVIMGKYDSVQEPLWVPNNCDFYIYTDQDIDENSIWKKRAIPDEIEDYSDIEKNRYLKMHPEIILNEYKYSIYVDGNVQIITDLTEYVNKLNSTGMGFHKHNRRNCVYEEMEIILKTKRATKKELNVHKEYLKATNMPKNYGLLQCNIIVREHHNPICIQVMNDWWNEFEKYTKRDQISLPHALFLNNINVESVGVLGNDAYINPSFRIVKHK